MIGYADIKNQLAATNPTSGESDLMDRKIMAAYAYIAAVTTLNMATSGDGFMEDFTVDGDRIVILSAKSEDIEIDHIDGIDGDYNTTTLTEDTDWIKISAREYYIPNRTAERVKVYFKSNFIQRGVDEIVKDIACYEYLKEGLKTGSINTTSKGLNMVQTNYKTEGTFYAEVAAAVERLFLKNGV